MDNVDALKDNMKKAPTFKRQGLFSFGVKNRAWLIINPDFLTKLQFVPSLYFAWPFPIVIITVRDRSRTCTYAMR